MGTHHRDGARAAGRRDRGPHRKPGRGCGSPPQPPPATRCRARRQPPGGRARQPWPRRGADRGRPLRACRSRRSGRPVCPSRALGSVDRRTEMTDARRGPSRIRPLWPLLAALLVVLSACSGGNNTTSSGGGGQVTLNTIWMKQAAYSDDEVKAMIAAVEAANPNIKVKAEFVQYESLHDKIGRASCRERVESSGGEGDVKRKDTCRRLM